jgi:hypothetical protein
VCSSSTLCLIGLLLPSLNPPYSFQISAWGNCHLTYGLSENTMKPDAAVNNLGPNFVRCYLNQTAQPYTYEPGE